jgi:hypothetical protein
VKLGEATAECGGRARCFRITADLRSAAGTANMTNLWRACRFGESRMSTAQPPRLATLALAASGENVNR